MKLLINNKLNCNIYCNIISRDIVELYVNVTLENKSKIYNLKQRDLISK